MAEDTLGTRDRERLDGMNFVTRQTELGTKLGDAQDRIVVLEAGSAVADGAITDAKLASDVKVGSLGDLTTTEQGNVVGAVNEVDANADAAVAAAALALQGESGFEVRTGKVTLGGANPTPVAFQGDTAAALTTTVDGSSGIDLSGVGDGGTILINPDGLGEDAATINAAAGTSVSGTSAATNITAETDDSFAISVDGDAAEDVALTLLNCDTGDNTATEMETKIRALGGNKASVTVTYSAGTGSYTITSPTLGTDSAVVITAPSTGGSIVEELELGATLGTETAGTGDTADITAVTLDELVALINGDIAGVTATHDGTYITITSDSEGAGSSLVAGDSTLKTLIGLAQGATAYGAVGLDFDSDMGDAAYLVAATLTGVTDPTDKALATNNKAASGFDLYCETAGATDDVDLIIIGTSAA